MLSGVLLLFREPFRSGDQIEVQDRTGTVEAITIRETRIKTYDGQLILIPNRDVYKSVIRVQTHFEQRRIAFVAGVAYENDAREACDVIREALSQVDGVAADPAPEALVRSWESPPSTSRPGAGRTRASTTRCWSSTPRSAR